MRPLDLARLAVLALATLASLGALAVFDLALGLDLQGGARFVYALEVPPGVDRDAARDRAREVIARRLDALALDAMVVARGEEIVVELAGDDAEVIAAARSALAIGGRLELLEVDDGWAGPRMPLAPDVALETEGLPGGSARFLSAHGPGARERLTAAIADEELAPDRALLLGEHEDGVRTYLVARSGGLDGSHVVDAELTEDPHGPPQILVRFDDAGGRALAELTTRLVQHRLAIVLDGVVLSAPVVQQPITGGSAAISLGHERDLEDARALALAIRMGGLPAPLSLASESIVAAGISPDTQSTAAGLALLGWIVLSLFGLRWRARGLAAVGLGIPLTTVIALALFATLGGTFTAMSFVGLALGALIAALLSAALLAGTRAWIVLAAAIAGTFVTLVMVALTFGPMRGVSFALACAMPAATLVALTLAAALTPLRA